MSFTYNNMIGRRNGWIGIEKNILSLRREMVDYDVGSIYLGKILMENIDLSFFFRKKLLFFFQLFIAL